MCLIIDTNKHRNFKNGCPVAFVAEKDITVWKIIDKDNNAIFMDYGYAPNKEYPRVRFGKYDTEPYSIDEGYHAYVSRKIARLNKNNDLEFYIDCKIVKFIIPKGSRYFLGDNNDIVANKIVSSDLKSS